MATSKLIEQLKSRIDQLVIQRDHWKQLASNRSAIVIVDVDPDSRSTTEYIINESHVRNMWSRIESLTAERDALRAELAAAKGQEPVATVHSGKSASGMPWCEVEWHVQPEPPAGTKLYALTPASPDVEGLVKALETARSELALYPASERYDQRLIGQIDTALSTWRQIKE